VCDVAAEIAFKIPDPMEPIIGDRLQVVDRFCACGMGERRRMERLYDPFPVRVRGVSAGGEYFEVDTTISDIGSGGLYVKLPFQVEVGLRLFVVIRFSTIALAIPRGPLLATSGRVVRVDAQPEGITGVAVEFTSSRFL
jgi:hypothetical protein